MRSTAFVLLVTLALGPTTSRANGPPERVVVRATGMCPRAVDVASALPALLQHHIVGTDSSEGAIEAKVHDGNETYDVRILGLSRRIPDASRDCGKRAQSAAVVIALALEPLSEPPEEHSPVTPLTDEPAIEKSSPPPRPFAVSKAQGHVNGETGTIFLVRFGLAFAFSPDRYGPAAGPRLGFGARSKAFSGSISGALLPAQGLNLDGGAPIGLTRYPMDLNAQYSVATPSSEVTLALGCALDMLLVGLADHASQSRLDVGPRAAIGFVYRDARVMPFVELDARWFPIDYRLILYPEGEVGRTPETYLGATVGLQLEKL